MGKAGIKERTRTGVSLPGTKRFTLIALIAVYLAAFIWSWVYWGILLSLLTLAAVALSLPYTGRSTRYMCLGLFAAGFYLILSSGGGWQPMLQAMEKNTALLVLIITVPLLGVPLRYGGYVEALDALAARHMRTRHQMYWVPALFSHALGVFMNIGALPLAHEITARGKLSGHPGLLAKSLSRGFGAAMVWSPNMIATATVLELLKVPWQSYFHQGLMVAFCILLTGYLVDLWGKEWRLAGAGPGPGGECPYLDRIKLLQLMLASFAFFAIVLLVEMNTSYPVIRTLPLLALAFPAAWLLLLGKKEFITAGYADYLLNKVNKHDGEVVLFAAAGFFTAALAFSGWSGKLSQYLMLFTSDSRFSAALIIMLAIMISSQVGIHPMVMASAFATSVDPQSIGFTPVQMALVLTSSWALGANAAPLSGTCLVVGGVTGRPPHEVAYANILHVLLVSSLVLLYVSF